MDSLDNVNQILDNGVSIAWLGLAGSIRGVRSPYRPLLLGGDCRGCRDLRLGRGRMRRMWLRMSTMMRLRVRMMRRARSLPGVSCLGWLATMQLLATDSNSFWISGAQCTN